MFRLYLYSIPILVFSFINTSFGDDDMSLDRLMMLHDILPETSLQMDANITVSPNRATLTLGVVKPQHLKAPVRVLIDVRSNHSDGAHDFDTLIQWAKNRHIDALAFTEHDRYTIRFGIDPVPHVLHYSQEHPSLYLTGLETFFSDLKAAQQQQDITIFAGTESTPGYYWQGIPFKNLSLHNAERHLITLGVKEPKHIQGLSSYDLRHAYGNTELSLIFWFVLVFMLMFILLRKRKRSIALLLAGSFIAFMTTWLMKPVVNPEEDFIHSAHQQGLFVIWTHPGTLSGVREGPMGVQLNTPPYNERAFHSASIDASADAFAAVYGDTDNNTAPAGLWDSYMIDYLAGVRPKPIWAVAAGDYHEEGQSREYLGNFPMDVWADSSDEDDILRALKHGQMASWHMKKNQHIAVKDLYLNYIDPATGEAKVLLAGGEAAIKRNVQVVVTLHELGVSSKHYDLTGQWIVDGEVVSKITLSTDKQGPVQAVQLHLSTGRHVIRFQIPPQQGIRMEANPFLVQVRN